MTTVARRRPVRLKPSTVTIDGEVVRVRVVRLTVAAFRRISRLAYPRGTVVDDPSDVYLARVLAVDRYVRPFEGEVLVNEAPVDRLGMLYGGRRDVIAALYHLLLEMQLLSAEDRERLRIAARFQAWLGDQKAKSESPWVKTGTNCAACHAASLCTSRGCDGQRQKRTVWHDGSIAVKVCPVLSFTPEVEDLLQIFDWTHEPEPTESGMRWRQTSLPAAGGLDDQEAWTMTGLSWLRQVHGLIAREYVKRARKDAQA